MVRQTTAGSLVHSENGFTITVMWTKSTLILLLFVSVLLPAPTHFLGHFIFFDEDGIEARIGNYFFVLCLLWPPWNPFSGELYSLPC